MYTLAASAAGASLDADRDDFAATERFFENEIRWLSNESADRSDWVTAEAFLRQHPEFDGIAAADIDEHTSALHRAARRHLAEGSNPMKVDT